MIVDSIRYAVRLTDSQNVLINNNLFLGVKLEAGLKIS